MKITIVSGSHRGGNSIRISHYIRDRLSNFKQCNLTEIINLGDSTIPLWNEAAWDKESALSQLWQNTADILASSDGIVIVVPEWSGMVPAALKNFFLYCSGRELGHKPGLICSVSGGAGGSYPVAELRMSSYKNNQLCYLPLHVIIKSASTFPDDPSKKEVNEALKERLDHSLAMLLNYSKALKALREEASPDFLHRYPYGM